ncbi:MAG TPA: flavodoxin [Candidatus Mcinerneyibacterium sp.]|nr:flavodoxin [Candidatus Mcinerneyibacterium sp.]
MNYLVVYYSRSGRTEIVAEHISNRLDCDVCEIFDTKKREGIIGWLKSGKDAFQHNKTDIKYDIDPDKYDFLIVGSPVWAGDITPAIRTFLDEVKKEDKKFAFFTTFGGSRGKAFDTMKELTEKPIAKLGLKTKEVMDDEILSENINSFIKKCRDIKDNKG